MPDVTLWSDNEVLDVGKITHTLHETQHYRNPCWSVLHRCNFLTHRNNIHQNSSSQRNTFEEKVRFSDDLFALLSRIIWHRNTIITDVTFRGYVVCFGDEWVLFCYVKFWGNILLVYERVKFTFILVLRTRVWRWVKWTLTIRVRFFYPFIWIQERGVEQTLMKFYPANKEDTFSFVHPIYGMTLSQLDFCYIKINTQKK